MTEWREKVYPRRYWYVRHGHVLRGEDAKSRGSERKDYGGVGREIVKEEWFCPSCYDYHQKIQRSEPELRTLMQFSEQLRLYDQVLGNGDSDV